MILSTNKYSSGTRKGRLEEQVAIGEWNNLRAKINKDSVINRDFKPLPIILGDERGDELLRGITNAILEDNYGSFVEGLETSCKPEENIEGSFGGGNSGDDSGSSSRVSSTSSSGGSAVSVSGCSSGSNSGGINTYPFGKPSSVFDTLLASCLGEMTLKEVLDYIRVWCGMALNKYPHGHNKLVILVTDKWDDNIFDNYSNGFRNLAMREDFWFVIIFKTRNAWLEIPFLPKSFYKSTRHVPEAIYKLYDDTDDNQLNDNNIRNKKLCNTKMLPYDFFFEGIAHFRILPGGESPICLFLENKNYCIISGTCYFAGVEHAVVAIGIWDGTRGIYSALQTGYNPIYCKNGLDAMTLIRVAERNPKILPIP